MHPRKLRWALNNTMQGLAGFRAVPFVSDRLSIVGVGFLGDRSFEILCRPLSSYF